MAIERDSQDLMYGLDELKCNGLTLGYIKEDSFDWGGTAGEVTPIRAAQVKGYAIKNLPKSNGTVAPTFDLIQFNYENMVKVLGGRLAKKASKVIGWVAPSKSVNIDGFFEIFTDSGQVIVIPAALVQGYIAGPLTMTETSTIKCTLNIDQPKGGGDPFAILDASEYTPYDAESDTPGVIPPAEAETLQTSQED